MTKLIVAFRNLANEPKNWLCFTEVLYLNNTHNFLTKEIYDSNLDTRGSKKEKLGRELNSTKSGSK